jgi:hypothetical protein
MSKQKKKEELILPPDFEAAMRKIANAPKEEVDRVLREQEEKKKEEQGDCESQED